MRYNSIVTSVKKKGYDLLDHRKGEVTKMPIVKLIQKSILSSSNL